ncbi:hypothetical protein L5515_005592 [Caenorhabditis briggsae]|uniref:Uncharacterized protein n=1 Tax=Caenorhabditis briggsae TaxID=6238 RepID=A0AAE9ENV0_CAEBR|nr:hypothetical protein L5515_005592 [Caenorhabditis briggsae]
MAIAMATIAREADLLAPFPHFDASLPERRGSSGEVTLPSSSLSGRKHFDVLGYCDKRGGGIVDLDSRLRSRAAMEPTDERLCRW